VTLAARGARDLDEGEALVEDPAERWQIRKQALGVMARGVLIGAGLMVPVLII